MKFNELRREIQFKAVRNFTPQDYQIMGHQVFKADSIPHAQAPEYLLWNHRKNNVWLIRNPANGWLFPVRSTNGGVQPTSFNGYRMFSDDDGKLEPMQLNKIFS